MADVGGQADVPPVPPITVHNKGPITNELLCYVSCKVRICTFDVIVKMCTDFYDSDVIAVAKDDLMGCVTLPEDDKRSGRRRVNLKEVHMKPGHCLHPPGKWKSNQKLSRCFWQVTSIMYLQCHLITLTCHVS